MPSLAPPPSKPNSRILGSSPHRRAAAPRATTLLGTLLSWALGLSSGAGCLSPAIVCFAFTEPCASSVVLRGRAVVAGAAARSAGLRPHANDDVDALDLGPGGGQRDAAHGQLPRRNVPQHAGRLAKEM